MYHPNTYGDPLEEYWSLIDDDYVLLLVQLRIARQIADDRLAGVPLETGGRIIVDVLPAFTSASTLAPLTRSSVSVGQLI